MYKRAQEKTSKMIHLRINKFSCRVIKFKIKLIIMHIIPKTRLSLMTPELQKTTDGKIKKETNTDSGFNLYTLIRVLDKIQNPKKENTDK